MISQHSYILSEWRSCFGSLNPSSGVHRLEIYRKMCLCSCNLITCGIPQIYKKFLLILFLVLQSLVDLSLFHNCPLLFLVLQLMSPIPYTC